MNRNNNVELGCGLIAIGRPWGTTPEVPAEADALRFLEAAYEAGIRSFDTAPSYGLSEERLGKFLSGLTAAERDSVRVSTKFGEHWDADRQAGYADHSEAAIMSSIDKSMRLLGSISVLQLHKASPSVIAQESVDNAIAYARQQGIPHIGASVSDVDTATLAIDDDRFDYLQLPYNPASLQFREPLELAGARGLDVITNRPFQMGALTAEQTDDKRAAAVAAFRFVLSAQFNGVVLTGTSNADHLHENVEAFADARSAL